MLPDAWKHFGAKEKRRQICGGVFFHKLEQLERKSLVGKLQCFDKNGRNLTLETDKTSKIIWCYNFFPKRKYDFLTFNFGSEFFWCSSHCMNNLTETWNQYGWLNLISVQMSTIYSHLSYQGQSVKPSYFQCVWTITERPKTTGRDIFSKSCDQLLSDSNLFFSKVYFYKVYPVHTSY